MPTTGVKARVLPPEEWDRVNSPGLPELLPYVRPDNIAIVVVEKDDEIVGIICALRATHLETMWVRPDCRRNPGVIRALMRTAFAVPLARGEEWVIGGADTDNHLMDSFCTRLGGRELKQKFYVLPAGGM